MCLNSAGACCGPIVPCSPTRTICKTFSSGHGGGCCLSGIRKMHCSAELSDQNCNSSHCNASTIQDQNRGAKRRNETNEGQVPVVLGSVSTNVTAHQHQHASLKHEICSVTLDPILPRCQLEKCSAYSSPSSREQTPQCCSLDAANAHEESDDGGHSGNDTCDPCCESEDYDYDAILTKILNEKKLALSKSPEVIEYLMNMQKQNK